MRTAQIAAFYGDEIAGAENSTSLLLAYLRERAEVDIAVFSTRRSALRRHAFVLPYLDRIPPMVLVVGNPVLDIWIGRLLSKTLASQGGFDLIHVQDVVCLPAAVSAAKALGIPLVATVRDPLPRSVDSANYPWLVARMGSLLLRYQDTRRLNALHRCARVVAISDFVKRSLVTRGITPERVETIYNPVGPIFRESHNQTQREDGHPSAHIFAAGRLWVEKGFHVLLQALPYVIARRPDVRATIAGTGPYENHLRDLTQRLDLSQHVSFVGQVPFPEMAARYADADLVVVPSIFTEPLGRTVLEAMACGRAVIASAVGGIPELIEDRKSGWLVPAGDTRALSEAIEALLADHSLRSSMGEKARRSIVRNFDDSRLVQRVVDVYRSLV